ncbi:MAG: dihydroorotase [Bacteroidota bacterium]
MRLLLRNVRIIGSGKNEKPTDILIVDGVIKIISSEIKEDYDRVVDVEGACVSPGWFDLRVNFRDPGDEHKETISSGLTAAAKGGFTDVLLMPSTTPPIQSKTDIEYVKSKAQGRLVNAHPAGCLSQGREGKDITEMFDMKSAGAIAFTDDKRPVSDSGLMLRALQYATNVGSLVMTYSDDSGISGKGVVNEGIPATESGLRSSPAFSEELMVSRDLEICRYADARLHFGTLSTKGSIDRIREAKKQGLKVTVDVCIHQLFFDDSAITGYDTNYKVKPPLRSKVDVDALKSALADGTVDAVCSDHAPQDEETKMVEFDFASYGIAGIETTFSALRTSCPDMPLGRLVEVLGNGPRRVLGLEEIQIKEGSNACITIFHPDMEHIPARENMASLSHNNPLIGVKLRGKVLGVVNNGLTELFI